ncbi:uncharacterized protein LOC131659127 [Vicia villosa]|uniref:uncharacterized protein LOC131659127 n=1 Tax=Vicia villosa TaxID=3911 RepID=UPI00273BD3B4|nr:uncharacterized protein LOC131659127 [Vicia villosa]
MVDKVVENGNFVGCNVNGICFIDVLQFVDDTLLVGDGSWNHLWAIKAVLKDFEIVSGLGINYHKSKLIGININPRFLEIATSFLACRTESKEFKFLGITIGSNPRRINYWRPLVDKMRKRLSSWKGRWVSLAIFTLYFFKAPMKVIKELNKIQNNFLWGASKDSRKMH